MGFQQISGIDPGETEMIDQIHCDTNPPEVAYSRFSRFMQILMQILMLIGSY